MYLIVRNPTDKQTLRDTEKRMSRDASVDENEVALAFIGQEPEWMWSAAESRFKRPGRDIRTREAVRRQEARIQAAFEREAEEAIPSWDLLLKLTHAAGLEGEDIDALYAAEARRAERRSTVESAAQISPEAVDSL